MTRRAKTNEAKTHLSALLAARPAFGHRFDSGPGYRIYFGRDGTTLIVLLGGGTKRRQQEDIEGARRLWRDYRRRRREE